jgi:phenylphosphate carboxylase alpha subunit
MISRTETPQSRATVTPRSQRDFISVLEREGDLIRISAEVDRDLEIGAITRRAIEHRLPALLFENIKGFPGQRVFCGELGPTRPVIQGRIALALGLSHKTTWAAIVAEATRRMANPLKPVVVRDAAWKQNSLRGDDVDLTRLPVPWIHAVDGGRFIGSWHINVTKDPDSDWVNWGIYRMMLQGPRQAGIRLHPRGQHGGFMYYQRYVRDRKPMPTAVVIGADPLSTMSAVAPLGTGSSEIEIAGALHGAPIEVAPCETIDLMVPANAEIVIEGYVDPVERDYEGPFGEYMGYCAGGRALMPVMRVTAVSYRDEPIFSMTNLGKLWNESDTIHSVVDSALLMHYFANEGLPVRAVAQTPHGVVISARAEPGLAQRVLASIQRGKSGSRVGGGGPLIVLVDEDIDPMNHDDVWWAMTTRLHPVNGIHRAESLPRPLQPWLSPEDREHGRNWFLLLDCTFPREWPEEYRNEHTRPVTFTLDYPKQLREQVIARWESLGLPPTDVQDDG